MATFEQELQRDDLRSNYRQRVEGQHVQVRNAVETWKNSFVSIRGQVPGGETDKLAEMDARAGVLVSEIEAILVDIKTAAGIA